MVARNRVVLSGTIAGGLEVFSCSMDYRLGTGSEVEPVALQTWAEDAADEVATGAVSWPVVTGIMGGAVNVTQVDIYGYAASGPAVAAGQAGTLWPGAGSISKPFSTALCVTKKTGQAGRRYRGRFYWPILACVANSDGTTVVNSAVPDEFRSLWQAIGAAAPAGGPAVPVVYSAVGNFLTDVRLLSVGNVPDSQRNRRDNLLETYQDSDPF